jgi:hypothetical protein
MAVVAPVSLVDIVTETRDAFLKAKSDGKLEAGEVVQIGVGVAQKLRGLSQISGGDKKSVALYCLREGLKAAGGVKELPGLKEAGEAAQKVLEEQLLSAASAAIDVAVAVARGTLDWTTVEAAKGCLPFCGWAVKSVAAAVLPQKDVDVLQKALGSAAAAVAAPVAAPAAAPAPAPVVESSSQESETKVSVQTAGSELILFQQIATDTTPAKESDTVSNQEASPAKSPSPTLEVKFD